MYMRSGGFSADEVISSWKAAMSDVMYDGRFDVVRAVETWSRRDVVPDMDELMMLESEMNRFLPLFPQVVVCLYDIDRFGSGIIVDLLKTHPRMLIGGMLVENPYYIVTRRTPVTWRSAAAPETADAEIEGGGQMVLRRDDWLELARKVDWTLPLCRRAGDVSRRNQRPPVVGT